MKSNFENKHELRADKVECFVTLIKFTEFT